MACGSGLGVAMGMLAALTVLTIGTGITIILSIIPLAITNIAASHANTTPACDRDDSVFGLSLTDCVFYQGILQIMFVGLLLLTFLTGMVLLIKRNDTCCLILALECLLLGGNVVASFGLNMLGGIVMFADGWACIGSGVTGVGIMTIVNLCLTSIIVFALSWTFL